MDISSIIWLALLVILLAVELATLGLTTIWFAGGALAAFAASLFHADMTVQIILFAVVSVLLLIFTRPFAVKYVNKSRVKTNADSLIGQKAVVTEEIDNHRETGTARIGGQIWTARSAKDDMVIPQGTDVKILEIRGVKLIVEKC